MATFTTNLNLEKPSIVENYDVLKFNSNADIIDEHIGILESSQLVTKEPTGFTNNENITVTYNSVARTITLTGTFEAYYKGVKVAALVNGWTSSPHADVEGNYFLSYNGTSFVFNTTPWTYDVLMIAYVQYNSHRLAIREVHGFMPWQAHEELHEVVGSYKRSGGDFSNFTLNSTVATNRRPQISATVVKDEDLLSTVPALTTNSYTHRYLSGAALRTFVTGQAEIIPNNGTIPYWNQNIGGNWQQTLFANNQYGAIFVVALPVSADSGSQAYRYMFVQPQQVSTDLNVIVALSPNNLTHGDTANLVSEFVFIGKIIIQATATNWTIISVEKLSGSRIGQTGSAPSTTGASYNTFTATIPSTAWTGASAPYSKVVAITGLLSTDEPIADLVLTGTYVTDQTMRNNWALIYRGVVADNQVTFYADAVPTADITIQLVVVR